MVLDAAHAEGFELAGLVPALPHQDIERYRQWTDAGLAADMRYLLDHRAKVREDPRLILPTARTMLCVGKLYRTDSPEIAPDQGRVASYAWGSEDYHDVVRSALHRVVDRIASMAGTFESRVCVDTAPLLERSYARQAGLGWIGKNTCLIREGQGSWFFLGEVLFSFEVDAFGSPPPDRCGTCTRCIDACPTAALVEMDGRWNLDSRACISYWTIEAKDVAPVGLREKFGALLFGCDICQDVCPWNRKAPLTEEPGFQPVNAAVELKNWSAAEFRERFRQTPVWRSKLEGWQRNVDIVRSILEQRGQQSEQLAGLRCGLAEDVIHLEGLGMDADAAVAGDADP
jgi:epoxyqueuosine reductase